MWKFRAAWLPCLVLWGLGLHPSAARAQAIESVGTRALGMGGAFVAVADDSSATWWNPAALAAGPFLDLGIGRSATSTDGRLPAERTGAWSFAAVTPPFGISYYRLRLTDIRPAMGIGPGVGNREDRRAGAGIRSLSVSQFGATILHTLFTGVHVGSTLKYVRGTGRHGVPAAEDDGAPIDALLDRGDDLEAGDASGTFDLDVGAIAVVGAWRVGGVVRNLRAPELDGITVPRQARIGAAFDGNAAGMSPFVASLDVDVAAYETGSGRRRSVAGGIEYWVRERRVGARAGARANTVGVKGAAAAGGVSVSPRAGMFVDAYAAVGSRGESGWGISARVSF